MIYSGSKWWKIDFHVHTPASHDYGRGNDDLKTLTPKEWLKRVMEKDIDGIVIADHNTGAWIDILKSSLEELKQEGYSKYRDMHIFPGVEINVSGGIHLLAIFDRDKKSDEIARFLGAIGYRGDFGDTSTNTNKSFSEVVEEIIKSNGIPIPAHVDKAKGLFQELKGASLKDSLIPRDLVAMELIDKKYGMPEIYKELKLNLSTVVGSDAHDIEDIGKRYCWVKMEYPTLDALWLALHDGQDGVIRFDETDMNPNELKDRLYIKKVEISNGKIIGRGPKKFNASFSPWLNTVIGGRGTGKSSIVNFLRLALNEVDSMPNTLKSEYNDFIAISNGKNSKGMLLEDTNIRIELNKDGRDIALVWKNNKIYEEHLNDQNTWEEKGECKLLNERFPVRIYSQKEIYEITKDANVLNNLIDRQFDSERYKKEIDTLKNKWFESRREERCISKYLKDKGELEVQLEDIMAKISLIENAKNNSVLEKYKQTCNTENKIDKIRGILNKNREVSLKILEDIKEINIPTKDELHIGEESYKTLENIILSVNEEYKLMESNINNYNNIIYKGIDDISNGLPWYKERDEIYEEYEKFKKDMNLTEEVDVNLYDNLLKRKLECEKRLSDIKSIESELKSKKHNSIKLLEDIENKYKEYEDARLNVVKLWNKNNSNIKIKLQVMGDVLNSEAEFRKIIRKEGITFRRDILEIDDDNNIVSGVIFNLCTHDLQEDVWQNRRDVLEGITSNIKIGSYGRNFLGYMERLFQDSPEDIDKLLVWVPKDKVSIKIVDSKKEFDVELGSAGQRSAALLSLILSLENTPLIIDQPEDDLDTQRISDLVVEGIRKLKIKQQVIIVTHNPNIPVNGAAEQIIHLSISNGNIQNETEGALQNMDIRQAICKVMEGGKTALDNRYHRISKVLQ